MFNPHFEARCRISVRGHIDIDRGTFSIVGEKLKEASCSWAARNKPYTETVLTALVESTDIRESEYMMGVGQLQLQERALRESQRRRRLGERVAIQ